MVFSGFLADETLRPDVRMRAGRDLVQLGLCATERNKSVEDRVEEGLAKIEVAEDSSVLEDE